MSELATMEKEVNDALSIAKRIVINNNDEETFAIEFCKIIKKAQKQVGEEFDENVDDAYAIHKKLVAHRAKYLDPLKKAEEKVKSLIKFYRLELERKRQEEESRRQAILDAHVKSEQERLMKAAEEAKSAGNDDQADKLAVQSVMIESGGVHVESKSIKQDGMSSSIVWKGRVVDLTQVPHEFLIITPNQRAIDLYIKLNGKNNQIKGVEYYQDVNLTVRTK